MGPIFENPVYRIQCLQCKEDDTFKLQFNAHENTNVTYRNSEYLLNHKTVCRIIFRWTEHTCIFLTFSPERCGKSEFILLWASKYSLFLCDLKHMSSSIQHQKCYIRDKSNSCIELGAAQFLGNIISKISTHKEHKINLTARKQWSPDLVVKFIRSWLKDPGLRILYVHIILVWV